jgi:DNA-binding NtrC family response regulator
VSKFTDSTRPSQTRKLGRVLKIPTCTLRVVSGPDRGREVTVEGRPLTIGKGDGCDLKLTDQSVSRNHASVSVGAQGYAIEDLESTNGTEVNGVLVKNAVLTPGCRIQLGDTVLEFTAAVRSLPSLPVKVDQLEYLVGASPGMQEVYGLIRQVAPTEATVVIRGETGTGKEVAARTIHALSRRKDGPFVVFDCANVNRDLMGSELFGHEKGAFTGAHAARRGAFEQASGGTLFLDEIGELPLELQARLLGAIQRRQVQRLGAENTFQVDTRILCATHRDLEAMCASKEFREDLYFRLAVITVELPPLRDRREDIPLLVARLVAELAPPGSPPPPVSAAALEHLGRELWTGNVRELRNQVERALIVSGGGEVLPAHFAPLKKAKPASSAAVQNVPVDLESAEKDAIMRALERNGGNKKRTAAELGIARSTLQRKLKDWGIADDGEE